jgi:CubicO group peptidase (beta-lactamase class C family)
MLDSWPAGHRAAAVLVGGEIVDDRGDVDVALPWASVTKLATALATLVAVQQGKLGLHTPSGPPRSTVRHLLAHASGLDFDTPEVRAEPGRRRIYSNTGYEVLAETVARAVGEPFSEWLQAAVLEPLGMTATGLEGSPAAGLVGPLGDLVGLAEELQRPWLLSPQGAKEMRTVAFPGLAGVLPGLGYQALNDWGLGPEVRGRKSPHWTGTASSPATFGHFGAAGGFVWVDPDAGVACACLTGLSFGPWAREAWPVLSDAVLAAHRTGPARMS